MLTTGKTVIAHENQQGIVPDSLLLQLCKHTPDCIVNTLDGCIVAGQQISHLKVFPFGVGKCLAVLNIDGMLQAPCAARILSDIPESGVFVIIIDIFLLMLVDMR